MRFGLPAALLSAVLSGCGPISIATIPVDGLVLNERIWKRDSEELTRRVAFEASCASDQIQLHPLSVLRGEVRARTVGVTACGHRLVYNRVDNVGWVLNSSDTTAK